MSRPARIGVTGAAGFIGSSLVDRLLSEGREVVGLDNFDPFYPEEEKLANLESATAHERFRLVRGDIRDEAAVEQLFTLAGPLDAVVHLAALAGVRPSLERPAAYADVNVRGTGVVLEAAARHGGPRFVLASSSSVYGERSQGPFRETDPVDRPISPYAATKRACELLAHTFHHVYGFDVTCVRFFTAYGPRQRPDLAIRKFAERMVRRESVPVYGDGSALRDYTYVGDVVDGVVRAIDRGHGYSILNFGSGREISVIQFARQLEKAVGVEADFDFQPRQPGDVSRTWADISAAREAIGYAPQTTFEEGIDQFVRWMRQRS
jgi:UDP-glucuronate 4-epimerase